MLHVNGEKGLTSRTGSVFKKDKFGLMLISLSTGTCGGDANGLLILSSWWESSRKIELRWRSGDMVDLSIRVGYGDGLDEVRDRIR